MPGYWIELNAMQLPSNLSSEVLNSLLFYKTEYDESPRSRIYFTFLGAKNINNTVDRMGESPDISTVAVSFPINNQISLNTY